MTLTFLLAGAAFAEDPVFAGTGEATTYDKAESSLVAEFGGSATSGNTEFFTATAGITGGYKQGQNKVSLVGSGLIGRGRADLDANGTLDPDERDGKMIRTAEKITGDLRYDRFFGQKNSLYLLGGVLHDPFAGFDFRAHVQFGYSHLFIKTDRALFRTEVGADYARENYVEGVDPNSANIFAARVMASGGYTFNEAVKLTETVELLENVRDPDDLRVNNQIALTAALSKALSFKVGHDLRFDNVPVEGFAKLDHTTTATIVATIL